MSLFELVDNSLTDKNTRHSYLGLYEKLLCKKKKTATFVLEVGVGDFEDKNGGSIKMWRDYFPNATIVGLDILHINRVMDELLNDDRVVLFMETNAYNKDFFANTFLNKNIKYDFLLDDGPHSLESMILFIKLYSQIMKDDGILIVEDVQRIEWLEYLSDVTPDYLKPYIKTYDLRHIKGQPDDIVFTIDKSN